ncbi:phage terminase large subunit family protein [Arhodomonas sp. AD133]|uniref:phage terminase large subunit family protein n=1 Tax=Arhodomonas sp. AD133 TaxID=3415009 RepID=UPI003EC12CD4
MGIDQSQYLASARQIRMDVAELLRAPRRIRPSEAAAESLMVVDGAGRVTPWSPDVASYMQEPLDCLASRLYDAVVFIGPARSGKTMALLEGWTAYVITCDPGDMLIVQISEDKAREYSKKRIDRALLNSPDLRKKLSPRGHDNNVHDKTFRAGNYLGIKWPSKNVLASSDYRFVAITDYDRLPDDIDGEGDAFTLGSKRTQTFGSSGMTMIECSPGREVQDADWRQPDDEPHAAPPAGGALAIYNQGDRRRLYWQCDHCRGWYQPIMEHWHAESARPFCPHCGAQPEPRDKRRLNRGARWVPEGCWLTDDGELRGERRDTRIASFWMEGPAAAYQTWRSLASKLATAEANFAETGNQETLKSVYNTDWGRPYTHRHGENRRSSECLIDRAEPLSKRAVPKGVRFLTAAVDVQGGQNRRFVVQVEGWGRAGERWIIDRFNIKDDRGPRNDQEPQPIDPATRPEDWDILTRDVLPRSYRLDDDSGRRMQVAMVGVDSGGEEGVTPNAYAWYRRLRREGLHKRAMLVKGSSTRTTTRIRKSYPDNTGRKERRSGARGDVPIYMLGTDQLKDTVAAMLDRESPGPGYMHIPDWLGRWWYDELTYEVRDTDGRWRKPGNRANETFDLCVYNQAVFIHIGGERINWDAPAQPWARPWDENVLVLSADTARAIREGAGIEQRPTRRRRRVSRSSYLGR